MITMLHDLICYWKRIRFGCSGGTLLGGIPREGSVKRYPEQFNRLLKYLEALPEDTDWITLGTWLLFSGKYSVSKRDLITKIKQSCWNNLIKNPLCKGSYLNGVERVSGDWRDILSMYGYLNDVCLIVDPPYLYTDNDGYCKDITAQDTLDLFEVTLRNNSFMLFTTGRLDIVDLIMRLDKNMAATTGKLVRRSKINAKIKNYLTEVCYYK